MIPQKYVNFAFLVIAGVCSMIFISKELFAMAKANLSSKYLKVIAFVMILFHLLFVLQLHFIMI